MRGNFATVFSTAKVQMAKDTILFGSDALIRAKLLLFLKLGAIIDASANPFLFLPMLKLQLQTAS
jgi:hypothetical protein